MILRDVEVDGQRTDVYVEDGRIATEGGGEVIDGGGGALIPGLWDHHIHLLATAAAASSVDVSEGLHVLANQPGEGWLRAVGLAHDTDRVTLDSVVSERPVRVQHRGGSLWVLNSRALELVGIDPLTSDGRLFRADEWLRRQIPRQPPDLGRLDLARYGVVGVTDMTPYTDLADLDALTALPQKVVATGGPQLAEARFPAPLMTGPVKVVVSDEALPDLDELAGWINRAHHAGRPVAVHCVTRVALALTIAAFDQAGSRPGDRIEHGAVVPPELGAELDRLGLVVVTQPSFIHERGDDYLQDVEPDDLPHLYPCASLTAVAGSTDAPYSSPDPWEAVAAAIHRVTRNGVVVGPDERVAPRRALELFLGAPDDPAGPPRRIDVGAPADLCLLDAPIAQVLADPRSERVVATFVAGELVR